jgi:hypothetical protein
MKFTKNMLKFEKAHQKLLAVLLVIYIVFNIGTPTFLATMVDTVIGKIVVIGLALSLFAHSGPIVGILSLVAAYELIKRSTVGTGSFGLKHFLPSEKSKSNSFRTWNSFPVTLEEEVVSKMAPLTNGAAMPNSSFKPVLSSTSCASSISS